MHVVTLTFFGGMEGIGGNCIVVEHDGHRIMLDNGMNFSAEQRFYKDFLMPRSTNDMRDLLALGLVPPVPGIYGASVLVDPCIDKVEPAARYMHAAKGVQSYEAYKEEHGKPFIEALLLSHAHVDHTRNIAFMAPEIPVIMSSTTKALLEAMGDVSFTDVTKYAPYEATTFGGMSFFPGGLKKERKPVDRTIMTCEPVAPLVFGPFTVRGHPVDHSVPGAMAYEIEAAGKRIVYTGDIRFHGVEQERQDAMRFVETMSTRDRVDALVTEGTRIRWDDDESETTVATRLHDAVCDKARDKAVFVSFPWKSIPRFLTVYKVARQLGRVMVIQPKLAYALHRLRETSALRGANVLHNEDLRVYMPRKQSMTYADEDYIMHKFVISLNVSWDRSTGDYKFYRDVYRRDKHVKAHEIHASPGKFLIHLDFYDLNELIDINVQGGHFFSLKTEPFDDEGALEKTVLESWLQRFGLDAHYIHASGHANGKDIIAMIRDVKPVHLFPVHTSHPECFEMRLREAGVPLPRIVAAIETGKPYPV